MPGLSRSDHGLWNSGAGPFGTGAFVTGSFTPQSNSLLVVCVAVNLNTGTDGAGNLTISGGGLTWTKQVSINSPGNFTDAVIFTAPVGTATSMTLTVDNGTNNVFEYNVAASSYTGYKAATPTGATGSSTGNSTATTTFSLSGAPALSSEVIAVQQQDGGFDCNPGSGFAEVNHSAPQDYFCAEVRTNSTSTTVTFSNPGTGVEYGAVALEIIAQTTDVDFIADNLTVGSPVLGTPTWLGLVLEDRVLDLGLNVLDTEASHIYICSSPPTTYAEATTTYALGFKSFGAGSVFGSPAAGTPNGRKVTSNAIVGGSVTANGTAIEWAVVDVSNTRLLAKGPFAAPLDVTNGQQFNLDAFAIHLPNVLNTE